MKLTLIRTPSRKTCTISMLFINDSTSKQCYVLEDIVREVPDTPVVLWKIDGATAIPVGDYEIVLSFSPEFKVITPELLNVPGFEGIRIHAGNRAADTKGCLITGTSIGDDGESVTGSDIARDALYAKIADAITQGEKVTIVIVP